VPLPAGLQLLQNPVVLGASGVMLAVEFLADKIPGVDSLWDVLHTLIRIPAGAALAAAVFGGDSAAWAMVAALMGGTLAATAHTAKASTRAAVNTSPEPFSNIGLSLAGRCRRARHVVAGLGATLVVLRCAGPGPGRGDRPHRAAGALPARLAVAPGRGRPAGRQGGAVSRPGWRLCLGRVAAVALTACTWAGAARPSDPAWALDLGEEVHRLEVTVTDARGRPVTAEIPLTLFRPAGDGPFPLAVISHGRSGPDQRRDQGRVRYDLVARWLVNKGFAVVVPTRLGYGETFGVADPEHSGSCAALRADEMALAASEQVVAAIDYVRTLPWADTRRWIAVGQSVGGLASLATAWRAPAGLQAVINFRHVQEDPDRQPRRDRLPRGRHRAPPGHPHRGRVLRRRRPGPPCAPPADEAVHRPAPRRATATCTSSASSTPRGQRRAGGAPGLRLPERERGLRAGLRRRRPGLHRPAAGAIAAMGSKAPPRR
jgi:dienelactone hydrolase